MNIFFLHINKKCLRNPHITMVARTSLKKLRLPFRLRDYSSSFQILQLYKASSALIIVVVQVLFIFWIGSSQKLKDLKTVPLFKFHLTLYLCDMTLVLGALYLLYRYYSFKCSRELITLILQPLPRPRSARSKFCVDICNFRLVRCGTSFFPGIFVMWNFLPSFLFPAEFNLSYFKFHVCAHLRDLH